MREPKENLTLTYRLKKSCFTKNAKMAMGRVVSGQIHPGGLKKGQHIEKTERKTLS